MSTRIGWDRATAVAHLNQRAHTHSQHKCARYTREAIEAGGLQLQRTMSAKDYGASLEAQGFIRMLIPPPIFKAGDVVIIEGFGKHADGHMAMYNGQKWVSDFKQHGLYPGTAYKTAQPGYTIYRYYSWDAEAYPN